jgi:murein DD-endopeptidase MepM/ murein hydrolase activator NlpD
MGVHRHSENSGNTHRCAIVLVCAVAAAAVSGVVVQKSAASAPLPTDAGYGWPVKPFDAPHPVRANFGDPRTTFMAPPTPVGLMHGIGSFTFHFGVDISVPDGTPVYPVRSGVAELRGGRTVQVNSDNGFAAQYWHIVPAIAPGRQVRADETILGYVMKGYEHVHFTELENGHAVNPLAAGHMKPYSDDTSPQVNAISFRSGHADSEILPEFVHGAVTPVVSAFDTPALRVPGMWSNLPVAPALLTWRVEEAKDAKVVVPTRIAFDVRETIPPDSYFWQYYARGSRQNMCTFNGQRAWREPGVYLYRLTRVPFDTKLLPNGIYRLVVTATDIRGNSGSSAEVFIVRNASRA